MTVRELIELLEDQDPEAEVRWMAQPSWPFEYSISSRPFIGEVEQRVCMAEIPDLPGEICYRPIEGAEGSTERWIHVGEVSDGEKTLTHLPRPHEVEPDDGQGFEPDGLPEIPPVYLVEGSQLGYGTKDAWS